MKLSFSKKIIRDFSRVAYTYDNYAILQRNVAEKLFKMWEPSNGRVLDIGCGTGYFHELLRKNKIYLPLVQTDISLSMCTAAANYASPPEYGGTYTCATDMHYLPFQDNSFSSLFSSMTLQWAEERNQAISEFARIMANKGTFALSVVGENSLAELHKSFVLAGYNPPIHKFAGGKEIADALKHAGFFIKEIRSESLKMFYTDVLHIMRSIKGVGASYKGERNAGIKGKSYFTEIEKIYRDKFLQGEGLPVSWNIIYVTGTK